MEEFDCDECKGTRRIKEADGTFHPCFKCLVNGKMDQHNKDLKDAPLNYRLKF